MSSEGYTGWRWKLLSNKQYAPHGDKPITSWPDEFTPGMMKPHRRAEKFLSIRSQTHIDAVGREVVAPVEGPHLC